MKMTFIRVTTIAIVTIVLTLCASVWLLTRDILFVAARTDSTFPGGGFAAPGATPVVIPAGQGRQVFIQVIRREGVGEFTCRGTAGSRRITVGYFVLGRVQIFEVNIRACELEVLSSKMLP